MGGAVAPGWDALGATEPGLPGISIGHNEKIAWGFTLLGVDQQDIYVEETDPANPNHYQYKGQWLPMEVDREPIQVKGKAVPETYDVKLTRHGPVLYEDAQRHRAYALRWVGSEPGGAGYIGSLNVCAHLRPLGRKACRHQAAGPTAAAQGVEKHAMSFLVDASAGTGKTNWLVRRIADVIETGVPMEGVVAVTFTKAAAGELKLRLRGELMSRDLKIAVKQLERPFVGTIHAFLRESPSPAPG